MAKWQQQFDQPQTCRSNTWMTPRGLLDHLKEFEDDVYHNALKYYLHNLYGEQKNSTRKNYSVYVVTKSTGAVLSEEYI